MPAKKPAPKAANENTNAENANAEVVRFSVDGESYEIDSDALTWGEMADVEEYFGKGLEELGNTRSFIALVALAMRRKNPDTSFEYVAGLPLKGISVDGERPTGAPAASGDLS